MQACHFHRVTASAVANLIAQDDHYLAEPMNGMWIGSGRYASVLAAAAILSGAAGYVTGSRPLLWSAGIVAVYVMHLISVSRARQACVRSESSLDRQRLELADQRERVSRLERELELRRAQAEEQWKLLRGMVRERLGEARAELREPGPPADEPETEVGDPSASRRPAADSRDHRLRAGRLDPDDAGRVYGRW